MRCRASIRRGPEPRNGRGRAFGFGRARAAAAGLSFRPATDADLPLLARVYASTRAEELSAVPLSEAHKTAFLESQFHCSTTQHRIIDIALLPDFRGHGAGEPLLRDLMDEAASVGKTVSIHVEKQNPALRLYRRLGFVTEEDRWWARHRTLARPPALHTLRVKTAYPNTAT